MALTAAQADAVWRAAGVLDRHDQHAFLAEVARQFAGRDEIGDGELFRRLRELQRQHHIFPLSTESRASHEAKIKRGYVK